MTFEQYIKQWLEQRIGQELKNVITEESISVELRDNLDMGDKWMRNAVFGIYCKFKKKTDAEKASQLVIKALPGLRNENYINGVYLDSQVAERTGTPFSWTYTVAVRVVYRNKSEW